MMENPLPLSDLFPGIQEQKHIWSYRLSGAVSVGQVWNGFRIAAPSMMEPPIIVNVTGVHPREEGTGHLTLSLNLMPTVVNQDVVVVCNSGAPVSLGCRQGIRAEPTEYVISLLFKRKGAWSVHGTLHRGTELLLELVFVVPFRSTPRAPSLPLLLPQAHIPKNRELFTFLTAKCDVHPDHALEYCDSLISHAVTASILVHLTDRQLEQAGVHRVGDRYRIASIVSPAKRKTPEAAS
jgi:hypothetical protein